MKNLIRKALIKLLAWLEKPKNRAKVEKQVKKFLDKKKK